MNLLQSSRTAAQKAWRTMASYGSLESASPMRLRKRERQHGYESLERRDMLSINFQFNYSLDTKNFFSSQTRKDLLVYAGKLVGQRLSDSLAAITPSGGNTWSATITDPATGNDKTFNNLSIKADTIIVYVGGRNISSLGIGGSRGFQSSGSSTWKTSVRTRGETGANSSPPTDVAPKVGSIAFDTSGTKWNFSKFTTNLAHDETDFVSVAAHELMHILGIAKGSSTNSWTRLISGGSFNGTKTKAAYGNRSVPVDSGLGHFREGVSVDGLEAAMDPTLSQGDRKFAGPLDFAALDDIGWDVGTSNDSIYRAQQTLTHIPLSDLGTSDSVSISGLIGSSNRDVDIYRIYAESGSRLSVVSTTTSFDSYLRLFNAAGEQVAHADQAATSGKDRLSFTFPRTDYFFVGVSSYRNRTYNPLTTSSGPGGTTGSYSLGITLNDPVAVRSSAAASAMPATSTAAAAPSAQAESSNGAGSSGMRVSSATPPATPGSLTGFVSTADSLGFDWTAVDSGQRSHSALGRSTRTAQSIDGNLSSLREFLVDAVLSETEAA